MNLTETDQDVRGLLARCIAELGHAPTTARLAHDARLSEREVEDSLHRLHEAHSILLHPNALSPWAVPPFALSPGSCWVQTGRCGYWANCLYCAFGIAAALRCDAVVTTRLGAERETVEFTIADGAVQPANAIFHLSVPVARWWDNVIHACSSFQPFRSEADADAWCGRHNFARGAILTLPALWRFASDWYGDYLATPWRKRSPDEVRAVFARHNLTGPFWSI